MKYAQRTKVTMAKSRADIEKTVTRYGAKGFISGWGEGTGMIAFELHGRHIKMKLKLPTPESYETSDGGRRRTKAQAKAAYEQGSRQCWRALSLVVIAKLECIESGISTIDQEFLAHLLLPSGQTVGERVMPDLVGLDAGKLPPLLGGAS